MLWLMDVAVAERCRCQSFAATGDAAAIRTGATAGGLDRNTCSHIEGLDSSSNLHDVRDFLGHIHITTTSRYVRSTPVRGVPLTGAALSALCDQLHRGSVRCVMVRFVTGLYTAIIHCG
jgi:hypothetical protein